MVGHDLVSPTHCQMKLCLIAECTVSDSNCWQSLANGAVNAIF